MFFRHMNNKENNIDPRLQKVREEYRKVIREMILEEIRVPTTHNTKIKVARIGEGIINDVTSARATKFIKSLVFNRGQIIDISVTGDRQLLSEYIVTYWTINDINNEIYKKVDASVVF